MGREAIAKGAHILLGPCINMQRSPLGGRGFESISEDPVLAGLGAAALTAGIQETGVVATIKHFVTNDQEHERTAVNAIVMERALREIYLMPFMIAMREAYPKAFMTAYNKLNGTHVSENEKIIQSTLREEWGWKGVVMSDWCVKLSSLSKPGFTDRSGRRANMEQVRHIWNLGSYQCWIGSRNAWSHQMAWRSLGSLSQLKQSAEA